MPIGGHVAASRADPEVDHDLGARGQGRDVDLGVQHLDSTRLRYVGAGDLLRPLSLEPGLGGLAGRHAHRELLHVQQHIGGVFLHAGDPGLHVLHARDAGPRHRRARHDGQEGAAQGVPDGEGVTLLERLGNQPPVAIGENLPLDRLRLLKRRSGHMPLLAARSAAYFENNSTMSCSCTGIWMPSPSGSPRTVPFLSLTSRSSHGGTGERPAVRLSATRSCILDVGRSCTTSPTFTMKDGIDTFRPFTWMCPWPIICLAARRTTALPRRNTTFSRGRSRNLSRFSPVMPFSASAQAK